jgi:hypothetical protein
LPAILVRGHCSDSLVFPTVMGCPSIGSGRLLVGTTLVVLFALTSTLDAVETNICTVSANPAGFDHRALTLEGIVAGLTKSTSRSGHKQTTFVLRSPVGCGGVIVYAQEPANLSNGDGFKSREYSKWNIAEMGPRSITKCRQRKSPRCRGSERDCITSARTKREHQTQQTATRQPRETG